MVWSEGVGASPHRREAASSPPEVCPHCEGTGWLDLGREATALVLREQRQDQVQQQRSHRNRLVAMVWAMFLVGWAAIAAEASVWGIVSGVLLTAAVGSTYAVHMRRRLRLPPPTLPDRWAMAMAPAGGCGAEIRGEATGDGEGLRAPITGRSCVAWELGIRRDAHPDGPLSSWSLLEQRLAPMRVGDRSVDPAGTHLQLPRQSLGPLVGLGLDEAARIHLEQRGVDPKTDDVFVFETVLEDGARVRLCQGEAAAVLRPASARED